MQGKSDSGARDDREQPRGNAPSRPTHIETADEPRSRAPGDSHGLRRTRLDQPPDEVPRVGRHTRLHGMGGEPFETEPPDPGNAEERRRPAATSGHRQTVLQSAGHGSAPVRPLAAVLAGFGPGAPAGTVFAVRDGRNSIGADPGCDVRLDRDAEVSGNHALLLSREGRFFLADRMSTNGTRVNEVPISPEAANEINDRDVIGVGGTVLQFFVVDRQID